MFGLAVSTTLVLLVLPALYVILDDLGATGFKPEILEDDTGPATA